MNQTPELLEESNSQNLDNTQNALPNENVVNKLTEIFDVDGFDGFLALLNNLENLIELRNSIDEPEEVELFSNSFNDPDFANFFADLFGFDANTFFAIETGGTITDRKGEIAGIKWNDLNGDGIKNEREPGLEGWTIYLDENQNGQLDSGEVSTKTDSEGKYSFTDLKVPKTYTVAEVSQLGWQKTFSSQENNPEHSVEISESELSARKTEWQNIPNDPLFEDQWHLLNNGQTGGTPGADANVIPAWSKVKGTGVTIGIVDSGLQYTHPDLAERYVPELSYDFVDNDPDPAPIFPEPDGHATSVAGIAAATANNNIGVSGVAPNAYLAGLRLTFEQDEEELSDSQIAAALSFKNQEIDIYNNSWGDTPFKTSIQPLTLAALQDGVRNGRGGLGNIFVFAGGNGRIQQDNVNYNALANSRYTIAVSGIDHNGKQTFSSSEGSSLLVAGYSGNLSPNITTTDLVGSDGYNPSSDYADDFDGTSASTPLVSGVIALMLEANPNLTYRDVQHILVNTSTQNDPTNPEWAINGAGHEVSHKYGFGAVDAEAAVNAAETWTSVKPEVVTTSKQIDIDTAIPDNDAEGLSSTVTITDDIQIEWAEVVFDATHTQRGDLEVTLTSPDGTESILAETHRDANDNYDRWIFTSARHWDEFSSGDWTLKVADKTTGETGTFNSWQLNLYGTAVDAPESKGSQQVTLSYGETVNNVNFGSRQMPSTPNYPEPKFGTVNADVLEVDSINQLVFAGNGNDLIDATASVGNNRIYGGDGDDTLILGAGDRLIAGVGADRFFAGVGGNNTLTGGEGADQFWIASAQTPTSPNIITDYNPTEDVIGVAGLGIGFEQLNLTQQGDDVLVQTADSDLAIFQGITADSLNADNFVFA